jgi:hypothetical protein
MVWGASVGEGPIKEEIGFLAWSAKTGVVEILNC